MLDFHGNAGGPGNNRLVFIPTTGLPGNEDGVYDAVRRFNEAIADRYVLHEASRPGVQQYEIESVSWESRRPTLIETACRDRLGFIVEVPAGYGDTYGLYLQTDVVIETAWPSSAPTNDPRDRLTALPTSAPAAGSSAL